MKELVEFMARSLVDETDEVRVTEQQRDRLRVIELRVAQSDLGKVIGRQGRTARAMRNLLAAACTKTGRRFSLDIID